MGASSIVSAGLLETAEGRHCNKLAATSAALRELPCLQCHSKPGSGSVAEYVHEKALRAEAWPFGKTNIGLQREHCASASKALRWFWLAQLQPYIRQTAFVKYNDHEWFTSAAAAC